MNTATLLKYGHQHVLDAIEGVEADQWETPGVCGVWSVKDLIAHLASYEQLLVDVLNGLISESPTLTLDRFLADYDAFNDNEVSDRADKSAEAILAEYTTAHERSIELVNQIPAEIQQWDGILEWYGDDYDLEDFIIYTIYAHKREHCAQIGIFRDQITTKQQI